MTWTTAQYPGDWVRQIRLRKGDEHGSIAIQDYSSTVVHPRYNYKIGAFLPGEIQDLPGDTPKIWPEKSEQVEDKAAADRIFDAYVQAAVADGWEVQ